MELVLAPTGGYEGRRGRTWITLTAAGNTALADEIGRLKLLIARVDPTVTPEDRRPPPRPSQPSTAGG